MGFIVYPAHGLCVAINTKYSYIGSDMQSHTTAAGRCASVRGHLVEVKSSDQMDIVVKMMQQEGNRVISRSFEYPGNLLVISDCFTLHHRLREKDLNITIAKRKQHHLLQYHLTV